MAAIRVTDILSAVLAESTDGNALPAALVRLCAGSWRSVVPGWH